MGMEAMLARRNCPQHVLRFVLRQANGASVFPGHWCSVVAYPSLWVRFDCRCVHTRDNNKGLSSIGRRQPISLVLLSLASSTEFSAQLTEQADDINETWYADGHEDPPMVGSSVWTPMIDSACNLQALLPLESTRTKACSTRSTRRHGPRQKKSIWVPQRIVKQWIRAIYSRNRHGPVIAAPNTRQPTPLLRQLVRRHGHNRVVLAIQARHELGHTRIPRRLWTFEERQLYVVLNSPIGT